MDKPLQYENVDKPLQFTLSVSTTPEMPIQARFMAVRESIGAMFSESEAPTVTLLEGRNMIPIAFRAGQILDRDEIGRKLREIEGVTEVGGALFAFKANSHARRR